MPLLRNILSDVRDRKYVLPEFQRNYVWNNTQVIEFADSIYKGYPIGVILVWKMDRQFVDKYSDLLKPLAGLTDDQPAEATYLVIDGQQRLTSLILLKKGEFQMGDRTRRARVFFNPVEQGFKLARGKELDKNLFWFDLVSVLDSSKTVSQVISEKASIIGDLSIKGNPKIENGLSDLRLKFEGYEIPIQEATIEVKEYLKLFEVIAEIFVRINRNGTKIRVTELVMALLTASMRSTVGKSFKGSVENFLNSEAKLGWDIDVPVFIRSFIAIAKNSGDLSKFGEELRKSMSITAADYMTWLEGTKQALQQSIELIKSQGIDNSGMIPSKYVLVPMAYYIYRNVIAKSRTISPSEQKGLFKWFVASSFWARYSASLDSRIESDIEVIAQNKTLDDLTNNVGRYLADEVGLAGDLTDAQKLLLYLTEKHNGAYDWDKLNTPKPIKDYCITKLEAHHIFPDNYVSLVAKDGEDISELAGDVANFTLISSSANEQIGDEKPSKYLKELYGRDSSFLSTHCIPLDAKLWEPEMFKEFLSKRREMLVQSSNGYLSSLSSSQL